MINKKRVFEDLPELEKKAKKATRPETLEELAEKNYANEAICYIIALNNYSNSRTIEMLATHPNRSVRRAAASRSDRIAKTEILIKLVYSHDSIIKENLANSTKDEGIKKLLLRSNKDNEIIVSTCLRRIHNMDEIRNYILKVSEEELKKYIKPLLYNAKLTELELMMLITACEDVAKKYSEVVCYHPNCTEKVRGLLETTKKE